MEASSNTVKIFISHSWADEDKISTQELVNHLNCYDSVDLYWDGNEEKLRFGSDLIAFMDLIKEADFVLLLLSEAYMKRDNCMYELATCLDWTGDL